MVRPRILVTGATGFLGPYVVAALRGRDAAVVTAARSAGDAAVDLSRPGMVDAVLEALAPDRVVNLVAMAKLGDCERDPARAQHVNATLPADLAARLGERLLHVSTDLVFDGRGAPYDEVAPVEPLSAYGVSKAAGEQAVLGSGGRVVRLPLLFGKDDRGRGASAMITAAVAGGQRLALFTNEYRTPLHAADAAEALAELTLDLGGPRLLHVGGPQRCSRWEFGQQVCAALDLSPALLTPAECQDPLRPRDVSLVTQWPQRRSFAAMLRDA
ncbi:MAG: sugar nucleotide-binding protein [Planctomycetes bacterium]|nr:sugar nucleotide-binding protein [Planctomycetota bacterium]MCB9886912.1 sugar nucleotide-binding protein [Planctomycetota bacterium]